MAKFEPLRITTPSSVLAARDYPGQGEPVVMLHGGSGLGDYFGTLPELLLPHTEPARFRGWNSRRPSPMRCCRSIVTLWQTWADPLDKNTCNPQAS